MKAARAFIGGLAIPLLVLQMVYIPVQTKVHGKWGFHDLHAWTFSPLCILIGLLISLIALEIGRTSD